MKRILLLIALLVGLSDGTIVVFDGFPLVHISALEVTIEGLSFPIGNIDALRYVPDNLVM